jgi:hypothetical protein
MGVNTCSRVDFSRVEDRIWRAVEIRVETCPCFNERRCRSEMRGHVCGCEVGNFVDREGGGGSRENARE